MNLILFENTDSPKMLPADDPRAVHVREVLKMSVGESFDVGAVGGPLGKATIIADDAQGMVLEVNWRDAPPPPPHPISLLVGLPRPQTARKILRECTSLGARAIHFFRPKKGERSYGASRLWSTGEWRRHLRQGAEQAFTTHIPEVRRFDSLGDAIEAIRPGVDRIALDVYEASIPLGAVSPHHGAAVIATGPERGWSAAERDLLREGGFTLAHLGPRVLRTETSCLTAVAIVAARAGLL